MTIFTGNIVDILKNKIYPGEIIVNNGKITEVKKINKKVKNYFLPGFIDSHIHVESSMLPPAEFARVAVIHGTVATVSDSHEIANVLGLNGVKFMIENAKKTPFKFYFSAPSCVPATMFETSGSILSTKEIEQLCRLKEIKYLGEMMNFPGVINQDPEVMNKIKIAKKYKKLIDGHAPGLTGEALKKYLSAGISTDHECFTEKEALEKISLGIKVLIREGSAAKNFDDLISIADKHYKNCMFCSDDKHPDDLGKGHINDLVRRAIKKGIDKMKVLQMACVNPVLHYGLNVGLLQKNDPADFIMIDDFEKLNILQTIISGRIVAKNGKTLIPRSKAKLVNKFAAKPKQIADFEIQGSKNKKICVIGVREGQLITDKISVNPKIENNKIVSDIKNDILKISVINRYQNTKPAIGFIKNFGLKKGAIASSVAHDSHNIIAAGVNDNDLFEAVNLIIKNKGGVCAVCQKDKIKKILPLPIAGLMSNDDFQKVDRQYTEIDQIAKKFGTKLRAPFMTLSFMALLVIPSLKISDQGLFDSEKFTFIEK